MWSNVVAMWRLFWRSVLSSRPPRARLDERLCWHHELGTEHQPARSLITSELVDFGRNKLFTCLGCGARWLLSELVR